MLCELVKYTDRQHIDKPKSMVGRVFDVEKSAMEVGNRAVLVCTNPGVEKSVITTKVISKFRMDIGIIMITENSIYYLVDCDKLRNKDEN
jgi:hypothetical protein